MHFFFIQLMFVSLVGLACSSEKKESDDVGASTTTSVIQEKAFEVAAGEAAVVASGNITIIISSNSFDEAVTGNISAASRSASNVAADSIHLEFDVIFQNSQGSAANVLSPIEIEVSISTSEIANSDNLYLVLIDHETGSELIVNRDDLTVLVDGENTVITFVLPTPETTIVVAEGTSDEVATTAPKSFTVQNLQTIVNSSRPTVVWSESDGADYYSLDLSLNSDCSDALYSYSNINVTSQQLDPLIDDTYFMCLTAVNSFGENALQPITLSMNIDYTNTSDIIGGFLLESGGALSLSTFAGNHSAWSLVEGMDSSSGAIIDGRLEYDRSALGKEMFFYTSKDASGYPVLRLAEDTGSGFGFSTIAGGVVTDLAFYNAGAAYTSDENIVAVWERVDDVLTKMLETSTNGGGATIIETDTPENQYESGAVRLAPNGDIKFLTIYDFVDLITPANSYRQAQLRTKSGTGAFSAEVALDTPSCDFGIFLHDYRIASNNTEYILNRCKTTLSDYVMYVSSNSGSGWTHSAIGVPESSSIGSLYVDDYENVHAVYSTANSVFYATNAFGRSLTNVETVVSGLTTVKSPAVVLDDTGAIRIVYSDVDSGNTRIREAYGSPSKWQFSTVKQLGNGDKAVVSRSLFKAQ